MGIEFDDKQSLLVEEIKSVDVFFVTESIKFFVKLKSDRADRGSEKTKNSFNDESSIYKKLPTILICAIFRPNESLDS